MPHPYSVLMSVYGKEKPEYLCESIQSVLRQTVRPQEIILVCDGPLTPALDDAVGRMERCAPDILHVVRLPENRGLGPALRAGLALCANEYIARMDSDDISLEERCEKQLSRMEEDCLDVCGASVVEVDAESRAVRGRRVLPGTHEKLAVFARRRNPFNHPSVMFRRSSVVRAGNYQDVAQFEDYDLWVRMLLNGARFGNLRETLLLMRVDSDFYARRGGTGYLRASCHFWRTARNRGFVTRAAAAGNILCRCGACLLPNRLREILYRYGLHGGTSR